MTLVGVRSRATRTLARWAAGLTGVGSACLPLGGPSLAFAAELPMGRGNDLAVRSRDRPRGVRRVARSTGCPRAQAQEAPSRAQRRRVGSRGIAPAPARDPRGPQRMG